jgi:hypothetical protein
LCGLYLLLIGQLGVHQNVLILFLKVAYLFLYHMVLPVYCGTGLRHLSKLFLNLLKVLLNFLQLGWNMSWIFGRSCRGYPLLLLILLALVLLLIGICKGRILSLWNLELSILCILVLCHLTLILLDSGGLAVSLVLLCLHVL